MKLNSMVEKDSLLIKDLTSLTSAIHSLPSHMKQLELDYEDLENQYTESKTSDQSTRLMAIQS
jgi:hypothetical protein